MKLPIPSFCVRNMYIIPGVALLIPNYDVSQAAGEIANGNEKWIIYRNGKLKEDEEQTYRKPMSLYPYFSDKKFFIAHVDKNFCYYIDRKTGTYNGPYRNASVFSYHKFAMVITVEGEFAWIDSEFRIIDPTTIHTLLGHSGAYHYVNDIHEDEGRTWSSISFGNEYFIEAEPFSDKGFAIVTTKKKSRMVMDINGVKYRLSQIGDDGIPKSFRCK